MTENKSLYRNKSCLEGQAILQLCSLSKSKNWKACALCKSCSWKTQKAGSTGSLCSLFHSQGQSVQAGKPEAGMK